MPSQAFNVSVILPVFNAAPFLDKAVKSVLAQPEVAEVLLVEDGSSDNSLELCRKLQQADNRIKLLTHPNGQNRGAGASRNLGLENATCNYIAFLDADDEYLPDRFTRAAGVFAEHPDADGVYESIGVTYHDEDLRQKHLSRVRWEETGVKKYVVPQDLFRTLATGKYGHIHLNGVVLKRSAISDSMMFDTSLRQCQDSDLMLRLSTNRTLYPVYPDRIVALRGVHPDNRVFNEKEALYYRKTYLRKCIDNNFYGSTDVVANLYIVTRYIGATEIFRRLKRPGLSTILKGVFISAFLISHPKVLFNLFGAVVRGRN